LFPAGSLHRHLDSFENRPSETAAASGKLSSYSFSLEKTVHTLNSNFNNRKILFAMVNSNTNVWTATFLQRFIIGSTRTAEVETEAQGTILLSESIKNTFKFQLGPGLKSTSKRF